MGHRHHHEKINLYSRKRASLFSQWSTKNCLKRDMVSAAKAIILQWRNLDILLNNSIIFLLWRQVTPYWAELKWEKFSQQSNLSHLIKNSYWLWIILIYYVPILQQREHHQKLQRGACMLHQIVSNIICHVQFICACQNHSYFPHNLWKLFLMCSLKGLQLFWG